MKNLSRTFSTLKFICIVSLLMTGCFSDDSNDDINEISLRKNEAITQSKSYISGRFTSIDGKPLAGVLVQAYSTEVGAGGTSEVFSAYTDYIGNYVIKDLAKSTYRVVPSKYGNLFIPQKRIISTADIKSDEFQGRVIIPEDLKAADFLTITDKIADFASYPRVVLPSGYSDLPVINASPVEFPTRLRYHQIPISLSYDIKYKNQFYTTFSTGQVAEITFRYDKSKLISQGLTEEFKVFYFDITAKKWKSIDQLSVNHSNSTVTAYSNKLAPVFLTATAPNKALAAPQECVYDDFGQITGLASAKYMIIDENYKFYIDQNYYVLPFSESDENKRTFEDLGFSQALAIATTNSGSNPYYNRLNNMEKNISFTAPTNIEVYVIYNSQTPSPWLFNNGFAQQKYSSGKNYIIETSNQGGSYTIFKKTYKTGQPVVLNGNRYGVSTYEPFNNYWVIIKPIGSTSCDTEPTYTFPPTRVTNLKAISGMDQSGKLSITLTWDNQFDFANGTIVIERSEDGPPMPYGGTELAKGINLTNFQDTSEDLKNSGTYFYTVSAVDQYGYRAGRVIKVEMTPPDNIKPVITLLGNNPVKVQVGTVYTDAKATAQDNIDGDLTGSIKETTNVDIAKIGNFWVRYDVSDSHGNQAVQVQRDVNVVDETPPVINLIGPNSVKVTLGTSYKDEGAEATDNYDGNISHSIAVLNNVDTATIGIYYVIYNVGDSSGNKAAQKIRTVVVEADTNAPVITLNNPDYKKIEVGTNYVEYGASAYDQIDGNIGNKVIISGSVNTLKLGDYIITYDVTDSSGLKADQKIRIVSVVDTTPPNIMILGDKEITIEGGISYSDSGAYAYDNYDGDISGNIIAINNVNPNKVGKYEVIYTVKDSSGNSAVSAVRIVNVVDTTPPLITLIGKEEIEVALNSLYYDQGAQAYDTVDGNITSSIKTNIIVNTNFLGDYTVTYDVSDSSGNKAEQVKRIVRVIIIDNDPPQIKLNGENTMFVESGSVFKDPGATANDDVDGNITHNIILFGKVNTAALGKYTLIYYVSDSSGKSSEVQRAVWVVDNTAPSIQIIGPKTEYINLGNNYVDKGATAYDNHDGNITNKIIVENFVNPYMIGEYEVVYNVADSSGNSAEPVIRKVYVKIFDDILPVIELNGPSEVKVPVGSTYEDHGARAADNVDGDISSEITVLNQINTNISGTYKIYYNVSDSSGNSAIQKVRTVKVLEGKIWYGDFKVNPNKSDFNKMEEIKGYTRITGNLRIIFSTNEKLPPLLFSSLAQVDGEVVISNNDNLRSLDGLLNLTRIGGSLKIGNNPQLNDISALSSLTSVGGDILIGGTVLENFSGLNFSRKTSVGGYLKITGNSLLKTLSGLEKIKSVEGDLVIDGNKKLTNLDGLLGLSYVNGRYIQIIENEKLNNNHAWVVINALKNSGRFNGNAVVQN